MSDNSYSLDNSASRMMSAGDALRGVQMHDQSVAKRVAREGIFGLGEAYIDGLWTTPHLDDVLYKLFTTPQPKLPLYIWAKWLLTIADQRLFNRQSGRGAFNIGIQHYDLGNDLFRTMLDPSMTYTSGYWAHATTLAQAQEAKLDLICRKLELRPGMRVLDIGCGWGNFAKYAAEKYGVSVTGITVSQQQLEEANRRCKGLPVEIRLQDYREMNETFDRIASIEMIEAVGRKNLSAFYRVVERCLKEDGLFALQAITGDTCSRSSDRRLDQYVLWLLKYIFPDGYLPTQSELAAAGSTNLRVEDWQNFGPDYDRTLLAWADNFASGWDQLKDKYGEKFRRRWEFYLYGCAAAFRADMVRVCQVVYCKAGNRRHGEPQR
jgi:cyclopropane-fatty-acyl-phospholipid synthase